MSAGLLAAPAAAQNAQQVQAQQQFQAPQAYSPQWSDQDIARIGEQLSGAWKTSEQVGDSTLWMTVAPVPVGGMENTLYAESVRGDTPWDPYRQAIFQLYRYKDTIRLRTYEFAVGSQAMGAFDGLWAATEYFPDISRDDLIATLDVELKPTETGFSGSTPYPYPTGVGGAVEMTSSLTLDADTMTVSDRGYNAQGEVVWGADTAVEFERARPYAAVTRREDGMIVIDYGGGTGVTNEQGDELHVHYEGFLADTTRFDSSYERDAPFIFAYPPGTRAITGWGIGMEGFEEGSHRKLIIPGYLAYGDRGNPRAGIPGNATLLFNVFMAHIDQSAQTQGGAQDAAQQGETQTHTHDDGTVHPGPDHD